MSKAFTREMDDAPEPALKPAPSALPPGVKNYFTANGVKNLRRELLELSAQPATSQIRQRLVDVQNRLQSAMVVEAPVPPWTQVFFGATVRIRNQQGGETSYAIVGVDETDMDMNRISWLSPVARALLKSRVGDRVCFRTPDGEQKWEIIEVFYEDNVAA